MIIGNDSIHEKLKKMLTKYMSNRYKSGQIKVLRDSVVRGLQPFHLCNNQWSITKKITKKDVSPVFFSFILIPPTKD